MQTALGSPTVIAGAEPRGIVASVPGECQPTRVKGLDGLVRHSRLVTRSPWQTTAFDQAATPPASQRVSPAREDDGRFPVERLDVSYMSVYDRHT